MSPNCPLCGQATTPWLDLPIDPKSNRPIKHGHLVRCSKCRYGFVWPRPGADEVGEFYQLDRYYTHGTGSHYVRTGKPGLLDRARVHLAWRLDRGRDSWEERLNALLNGRPSDVCDLGCGHGALAARFRQLGHRVIGIEVDGEAAAQARSRGVTVLAGTAEKLPDELLPATFDVVIMSHVLEHCVDPTAAAGNVARLLREGGQFIVEVPNNESLGASWAGIAWDWLDVPRHLNFFTGYSLRQLCSRAGLDVCESYYSGYCRQFTNDWIATERRNGEVLRKAGAAAPLTGRLRSWLLLLRTAVAPARRKYDSVGIVARKKSHSRQD
jgi:SAM-dependent methyltransferase